MAVVSWADEAYTQRKFATNPPRVETYVFMQGRLFESATRDRSLERLDFRKIAESIAVEIARENYLPAADVQSADLLLLVHWGTTTPAVSSDELRGITTFGIPPEPQHDPDEVLEDHPPDDAASDFFVDASEKYRVYAFEELGRITEGLAGDTRAGSNSNLLGYTAQLRRLSRMSMMSPTEQTLRSDLHTERYFIIVKAFDLKAPRVSGAHAKPVWTLHLNMRSPGQNFGMALARMSEVAVDFAGKTNLDVTTINTGKRQRKGVVILGPVKVIGVVE